MRRADTTNLLQVLAHGVAAGKLYRAPAMPGFHGELSHEQIALLANHTRETFGDRQDSAVTAQDVAHVVAPDDDMPRPLRLLQIAAWAGVAAVAGAAVVLMIWWRRRHRRRL